MYYLTFKAQIPFDKDEPVPDMLGYWYVYVHVHNLNLFTIKSVTQTLQSFNVKYSSLHYPLNFTMREIAGSEFYFFNF